jgi:hypothetical protein
MTKLALDEKIRILFFRPLSKANYLFVHTFVARALTIILTAYWYMFAVRSIAWGKRFAFAIMLLTLFKVACYSLGLWISTTRWGTKHKWLTSILLIPSLILSPVMVSHYNHVIAWVVFAVAIWSYWIIIREENYL